MLQPLLPDWSGARATPLTPNPMELIPSTCVGGGAVCGA